MTITVFTKPACVQCRAVKAWLDARGLAYTLRDVANDPAAMADAEATGVRRMPIVVASGMEAFGVFIPELLATASILAAGSDVDGFAGQGSAREGRPLSGPDNGSGDAR